MTATEFLWKFSISLARTYAKGAEHIRLHPEEWQNKLLCGTERRHTTLQHSGEMLQVHQPSADIHMAGKGARTSAGTCHSTFYDWLGQYGFTPVESGLAAEPSMKWVERTSFLQTPMPRQPQHPLPCVTPPCEQFRGARSSPESISGKKHAGTSTVDSQEIQSSQILILWPFTLKRVIEKTTAIKTWVCTSLQ